MRLCVPSVPSVLSVSNPSPTVLDQRPTLAHDAPGRERPEGSAWLWAGSALFLLFAGLPLLALVLAAVPAQPLQHLREPVVQDALRLSILTSLTSTVLCVLLGTPLAYLLARFRPRGWQALDTLVDLPMTLPPVVAGVALLYTFGRMGLLGATLERMGVRIAFSTVAVVLAQTFMAAPFFIRSARAGFEGVPVVLEHAAMTLGRSRWGVFWSVTLPLAGPVLLAGVVLAWARALSEFGATMLFAGNLPGITQTLPLAILTAMESDLHVAVSLSVLSLALAFGALMGVRLLVARSTR